MNSWSVGQIGRVHVMYSTRVQIILEPADAELPLDPSLPSELTAEVEVHFPVMDWPSQNTDLNIIKAT